MDILFTNGTIRTMERDRPAAHALLVRNGRIAAVGDRTAVEDQAGVDVRRVDLAGRALLPAFLDAHSHFTAVANQFLQVDLSGCGSWADIQDRIRDYIRRERIPAGQWVTAQGYDHNRLSERRHPDRTCLDAAAPENPVVICHQSGHMGVFNTAALERLGVTGDTPCPAGGVIGQENGVPTGYMEENAFLEFQKRVPMMPLEAFLGAYRKAQDLYASYGITTVQEGLLRRELVPLYQALLADGSLKLDVVAYGDEAGTTAARQAFPDSFRQYQQHFKLGGYKLFLDGSPQGRTAWLRQPYQGETAYRGYGTLTDAQVLDMVRRAGAEGMQLLAHCNGDAACAQYLAALETAAREGVDLAAMRPVMIHAQLLGRDQLPAVKRLGVIPSFFVAHVYHWGDIHWENLGSDRADGISPAGSAAELGIPCTFHTDAPVIPPDLLETVWCAVDRTTRSGRCLGPEERVDVQTALEAVTVNAAYQYFEERDKGALAPGKRADLVMLDRDPLAVPPEELRDIQVLETWKDGIPIFRRGEKNPCNFCRED
ncbi:MAG TPA: amidohydrolase [Candidatus Oscillibacter excrementigallinarum]|uniref:Amidohydrolase n=1 Tax=Candidatus Oscillibacter excrementigallinarum TaxID=2838716 RepID=A0A9D2LJC7_9FIRM|nr:amidohydrolase [Candidatus Oscillibacter excrementigallinarum]